MKRGAGLVPALMTSTLLALAILAATLWRGRAPAPMPPIRLFERALADPSTAHFEFATAERPPRAVQRWQFSGSRAGWIELDERGALATANGGSERSQSIDRSDGAAVLRFAAARGGLIHAIPMAPQRLLRVVATVTRAKVPGGGPVVGNAAPRVFAQPTLRPLQLATELASRSYLELALDRTVLLTTEPLLGSASAPADGQRHELAVTLVTPAETQGLTLLFAAGDGSVAGEVDLEEVRVEEVPLRDWLALGGSSEAAPSAADAALSLVAPFSPREIGVLDPPVAALPALRKVEHLLEQRDSVLLPPPALAAFECDLPAGSWRLEYGVARLFESRKNFGRAKLAVELRVVAPGRAAWHQRTNLEPHETAGWIDRTLDLNDHVGGRIRVEFECNAETKSADLAVVGAPILRRLGAIDPRWNVILVSLDTVRADHLSVNGYPRPTTPNLDELARQSAWFRAASSTSSYTLPAHASLFTGQLPSRHGAHSESPGRNRLWSDRSDLLADRFREEGWLTAAFTGGVYLRASFGFDQGFDRYDATDLALPLDTERARKLPFHGEPERNAAYRKGRPFGHALEWIRAHADAPFFLFLHTYLAHEYVAGPANEARFLGSTQSTLARGDLKFIRDRTLTESPTPGDLQRYVDAYDATLREADDHVGALLALLDDLQLDDRTIVIVVSDHGEEFLDHGSVNHGRTLYEEMVHVPLLMRVPGAAAREIDLPVSLLDVAPTLIELCGLTSRHAQDGRSLVELLRGGTLPSVPIEAELDLIRENRWFMRRLDGDKSIEVRDERSAARVAEDARARAAPRRMDFAVGLDPNETRDRAHATPEEEALAAERFEQLAEQRDAARERRAAAKRDERATPSSADQFDVSKIGGYVEHRPEDDAEDAESDGG